MASSEKEAVQSPQLLNQHRDMAISKDSTAANTPETLMAGERVGGIVHGNVSNLELDAADRDLAAMGYAPVFQRHFGPWACFSFALSISGLFGTVMTTFVYPLTAGGAASAVWCWLIAGFGSFCLALSIAEISSAYPTSGAMYFVIKYLAPEKYVPVIAWVDGWLNLIGQICGVASSSYGAAAMLLAAVSIGSDFVYAPTQVRDAFLNMLRRSNDEHVY